MYVCEVRSRVCTCVRKHALSAIANGEIHASYQNERRRDEEGLIQRKHGYILFFKIINGMAARRRETHRTVPLSFC